MASRFRVQIVERESGTVVAEWIPGRLQEETFIADICQRVKAKGVGLGRTTSHVLTDVQVAIEDWLTSLKSQV